MKNCLMTSNNSEQASLATVIINHGAFNLQLNKQVLGRCPCLSTFCIHEFAILIDSFVSNVIRQSCIRTSFKYLPTSFC